MTSDDFIHALELLFDLSSFLTSCILVRVFWLNMYWNSERVSGIPVEGTQV